MDDDLLKLVSDVDQDRAALETWWREHSDEVKALVWLEIQREQKNPFREIMSRFAQLAFSEAAIRFSSEASS